MTLSYRSRKSGNHLRAIAIVIFLLPISTFAQMNYSNWVYRNSTDTTVAKCRNDSASTVIFPPGSMSGMMMNLPDSIYCDIDEMPLDSLNAPHDSTFIGWYEIQIGQDSMDFNLMSYSMMGNGGMMQFSRGLLCHLYWDSLMVDSMYQHWHPAGIMAWNGSNWVAISNVSVTGNNATFTTSEAYSAIAFVGAPEKTTVVVGHSRTPSTFSLNQNFPNPFNPTTVISYQLPSASRVTLKVYDILGNEVTTLANGTESAGVHSVQFSGSGLASGVYFYRLSTRNYVRTMKMIELK